MTNFCFVLKNTRELAKKFLKTFFPLENASIFWKIYKILERRQFFYGERLNFPKNLRIFGAKTFFWGSLSRCVLGLKHSCP